MFARIRRLWSQFFSKTRTINNEPLNRVSLIVIILIDIFILINVFTGLDDISRWHLSPTQAYPCYSEWESYRTQPAKDKDDEILRLSVPATSASERSTFQKTYQQVEAGHLGKVSETCLNYAAYKDKLNSPENKQILRTIEQKQTSINTLEQANSSIRARYDSTLLEKIAGQPQNQSINAVSAEKAKQELDQNNLKISTFKKDVSQLEDGLAKKPESTDFLSFLKNDGQFRAVEQGFQKASFWYPSIQLAFQSLFLLPLICIALLVHTSAQRKGYGLISLISWHLLVIFFIPLILKVFEFLQVGALFQFLFDILSALFSGLLFLISYLYILIIPLIGFGIIKFFQKIVFNIKVQAANRVQKSCCIKCAKKIQSHDSYCPHCGYYQYIECENCHNLTYKHLPYCKQCGFSQPSNEL
jgi:predicted RNA-binding Zn-ribbon protein involved in translation (DUF1610 family)